MLPWLLQFQLQMEEVVNWTAIQIEIILSTTKVEYIVLSQSSKRDLIHLIFCILPVVKCSVN